MAGLYESFDFAEAARVAYRFVWNEVCDWYLEIAKARLYGDDETERLQVSGNLLALLERIMGLLHPMMPFVTAEVYRNLPRASAAGDAQASADLLNARFPVADPGWADESAERAMVSFIAAVAGVRSAREELDVRRDAVGRVWIVAPDPELVSALTGQPGALRQLCGCEIAGVVAQEDEVPAGRFTTVAAPGLTVLLPLEGLVDAEKERARLLGRAQKAAADIARANAKLANERFVDKAPPEVVAQERERLALAEDLLADVARQYRERLGEDLPL
jgi:valyl-tRNA synthetase